MKSSFVIYCDGDAHDGQTNLVHSFRIFTSREGKSALHPLGSDASGNLVSPLLHDNVPMSGEITDERFENLVKRKRIRMKYNFQCNCGKAVGIKGEKFLEISKDLMNTGVSQVSLTSLVTIVRK